MKSLALLLLLLLALAIGQASARCNCAVCKTTFRTAQSVLKRLKEPIIEAVDEQCEMPGEKLSEFCNNTIHEAFPMLLGVFGDVLLRPPAAVMNALEEGCRAVPPFYYELCVGGLEVFYLDLVRMALNIVENDIEHYEDLFSEWCSAPPPQLIALCLELVEPLYDVVLNADPTKVCTIRGCCS